VDVAALSVWVELARSHVFDHMLTQRTDSVSLAHGSSFLSEVDDTSILRTGALYRYHYLGSCSRAAGWSAATLCFGTKLRIREVRWTVVFEGKAEVARISHFGSV
jgi:hypothetical protein